MKNFEEYKIEFVGLKDGEHHYTYDIDNSFFEKFEYKEFNEAAVQVNLSLIKKENILDLIIDMKGSVNVNCDVTNEPYDQPIEHNMNIVVKFGEEYNDEDEEVLILPYSEIELKVQQFIYEGIILAVPYKKVHPGVEDGTLDSEILDKLRELSPGTPEKGQKEETDPRWDKLKDLLNKN